MALEINDQFDFFKAVQLDDDGNLLVSIVNGVSTFTGGTIDNLTVTGSTILNSLSATSITAGTIVSDSLLWEEIDANLNSANKTTILKSSDGAGSFNLNGLMHGSVITMSQSSHSAILASNSSSIAKAYDAILMGSEGSNVFNTDQSGIFASIGGVIGEDTGTLTGSRNVIISSESSNIRNTGPSTYWGIYNSSIISSDNCDILATNGLGETTERVILLGMKNYTAETPGVHVENLYITSGATGGYVWTSVDSSGRGEWRENTLSNNYYTTGATLSGTVVTFDRNDLLAAYTVDLASIAGGGNIDGGTAASITLDLNVDGGNASS